MNTNLSLIKHRFNCKDILSFKGISSNPGKGNISCPICGHGQNTPCFGVYGNGQRFKCFFCNAGGDVVSLYMALFQCDFKQAVSELTGRVGL